MAAESPADRAIAKALGYAVISTDGIDPLEYRVIFNTVPYTVFTKDVLSALSPSTLIIDLAGDDGGVDRVAAEAIGIKTIWALSLPGKVAPFTAAGIICDCVLELLREKGVIKPK